MISRRVGLLIAVSSAAVSCFTLGVVHARRTDAKMRAEDDASLDAIRSELRRELEIERANMVPAGTAGQGERREASVDETDSSRAKLMAEIKEELQNEMGLVPLRLLRERRSSFVEAVRGRQPRKNQLRYGRLRGQRLFRHREARRRGPQGRRQPG